QHSQIFVRIFKKESELEVWKQRRDGRFYHFKTYPICTWSGKLGQKRRQGDKQAPEGFYKVNRHRMNPNSKFHLAFNLGYPNAYDRAHNRTGNFLMVHGKCSSAGCYAMTDGIIEEVYALARESFIGGQQEFEVHAFPFRMTDENMRRYRKDRNYRFWQTLKQGYDYFELTRMPPKVAICERRYHVNVAWNGPKPAANGICPTFTRPPLQPFWPPVGDEQIAKQRIVVPGIKKRQFASRRPINRSARTGLTQSSLTESGQSKAKTPDLIGKIIELTRPVLGQ
ncbi:MAG: L,D-transpeptidase family protein, partial [Hyphomicrobiaceae bacterium]